MIEFQLWSGVSVMSREGSNLFILKDDKTGGGKRKGGSKREREGEEHKRHRRREHERGRSMRK